jgi:hypothetical protein
MRGKRGESFKNSSVLQFFSDMSAPQPSSAGFRYCNLKASEFKSKNGLGDDAKL